MRQAPSKKGPPPRRGTGGGSESLRKPESRPARPPVRADNGLDQAPLYAALDLGTNNCRLMIAAWHNGQFRIVEAFSRIVRLGEGLSQSGRLSDRAIDRAMAALRLCAEKVGRRQVVKIRAVATQACRIARNGPDFIRRVEKETGLKLTIIPPEEEARLSVVGCASLLEGDAKAAIVMDVGGGSTEISWLSLETPAPKSGRNGAHGLSATRGAPKPQHWISIPKGVVNLAERFPEPATGDKQVWFDSMVADVQAALQDFKGPEALRPHFDAQDAYIVGTSGAITSLAGMHLGLERYDRSKVDGLWMSHDQCRAVIDRLLSLGQSGREGEPCIGKDRADLVLAGAAILEAVQNLWPCDRLRVADRGLREGLLLSMVKKKTRRRRRSRGGRSAASTN
ncbi:Ppx/GppA phosphatase family protein [Asticcacaulis sp. BYS171W]|uniref:Ppx/GppA phosphatase family protein n=1 Tax=Asticcacaulis aquaticus TaxID=2984212 RepID=A0ABT5HPP5_9CAUL|nr:Ppx/GppA phosphatase family protein [Asticcacaulis aquaticus]MDC7682048.1 Ppx/GppA phosphatase family protein [Asticcacaulis aquaticus]